jgi:tetratricopeptide (TPR) repeat protein
MAWLGIHKGDIAQSRGWLNAAAAQVRSLGDTHLLYLVLCGQGLLVPDFVAAIRLLDEALEIAQRFGWQREQAQAMWALGTRMRREGDPQRATQLLTRGLALAREVGDRYFCAQILLKLGLRALDRADYEPARALLEESVALARQLGAEVGIADSLIELGTLGVRQCDFDLARPAIKESAIAYGKAGNVQRLAQCVSMAAGIADALGRVDQAARLLAAVATARGDAPRRLEYNSTLYEEYDQLLPRVRAELDPAAFESAWAEGRQMTLNQAIQEALAV